MSFNRYSLPVHLIRQHLFCPRIPWYQEVMGLKPARPQWVRQGEEFHKKQPNIFRHRSLKRFNLEKAEKRFDFPVSSSRWNMHGLIDLVLFTETTAHAVEIKISGNKPSQGHRLQLAAYALLLEEKTGKDASQGFILLHHRGKTYPLLIDDSLIQAMQTVKCQILENFFNGGLPDSPATPAQCTQCEYLNHCNDRA